MKKTNKKSKKTTVTVRVAPKRKGKTNGKAKRPTAMGALMRAGGSAIGTYFGGPLGGALGQAAGGFVSRLTGHGDYKVKRNCLMDGNTFTFSKGSDGEMFLSRRELVGVVPSSQDFSIQGFSLNPGLPGTFPWGAGIAKLYEQYDMLGLVFEFKTTSGNVSTNPALGAVYFATEYDPDKAAYGSKVEMMTSLFAQETVPSKDLLHPVECASKEDLFGNKRYVRFTTSTSDLRFSDLGTFYVATEGQSVDGAQLGELWVTYKWRLYKPLYSTAAADVRQSYFNGSGGTRDSNWLGASPTSHGQNYTTASTNTLTFLTAGKYVVNAMVKITSSETIAGTWGSLGWTGTANIQEVDYGVYTPTTASYDSYAPNATKNDSQITATVTVIVSAAGQTAVLPANSFSAGTFSFCGVTIIKVGEYSAAPLSNKLRNKQLLNEDLDFLRKFRALIAGPPTSQSESDSEYERVPEKGVVKKIN